MPRISRAGGASARSCRAVVAPNTYMSTTGQTSHPGCRYSVLFGFDGTQGGHVPCGVTAHGRPGGPLQFGRLEAALAAKFHWNAVPKLSGASPWDGSMVRKETPCQTMPIKEQPSSTISPHTRIARPLCIMASRITRLRMNTRKREWNTRIKLINDGRRRSRNQLTLPSKATRRTQR